MDVHKAELQASGFRAIIEVARAELGEEAVAEMCRALGTSVEELSDQSAWFSMKLGEELLAQVVERTGDEAVIMRIMKLALSPRYLGFVYPLFRAVGTPALLYGTIAKLSVRLNKVVEMSAESLGRNRMRVSVRRAPGAPTESKPYFCRARAIQIGEGTTILGLPPARIEHPFCMLRGDEACVYDVEWSEHRWPILSFSGVAVGAIAGSSLISLYGPTLPIVITSLALCAGGWAAGRVYEVKRALTTRLEDLNGTYGALEQVTKVNEQRVAELMQAKAEVEQKVEQRTHELSLTTQQLSETLNQVQELDRAKTNFFSNVSHDLRTPLTLILGPLGEMSQGREPPGGQASAVDVMQRNGMRLLDLINQILDLAKIDAGKMQLARVPTNLADLARTVAARFSAQAVERKLILSVNAGAIAQLLIDSAWIETALTNLVGNAMRFARSTVMLNVRDAEGAVIIEVEDDGPGIASEDLGTVFDRFAQGSDVQARKGGTGLGLAIVREAVRLHGGDASVRSIPGQATTFTLTLPRAMSAAADGTSVRPPAAAVDAEARLSTANRLSAPPPKMVTADRLDWPGPGPSAPLVVVVEDDDDLRVFTSEVLASTYRVQAARNGEEGLALIKEVRPDAVVSDVVMPKMDGYELCRQLRKRDDTRALPVILLTARRDVGRVLEGFDAGADDYVTKPFQARELLARISVHVRLRRLVSEMAHRERLASLGMLAASLAHQVRNPLNAILAGLPAVRRKLKAALDHRDDEIFGAMIDSGERINTLIKDLMDLSRVDQEAVMRFKPSEGVRSCVRLIEARIQGSVQIECDLDDAVEMEGKAGDLSHVFLNLIDNAVRAAEPSGRVHLHVERRGNDVIFEVGDSGPGIPPDKLESVFAPFYTTRAAGEGTGLGLAIARQVVIQHGGNIAISRSPLGGALFTVTLPTSISVPPPALDQPAAPTVH